MTPRRRDAEERRRICLRIGISALFFAVSLRADIGSGACKACHAAIYQKYMQTGMARSSGRTPAGGESFEHAEFDQSGVHYRVEPSRFEFDLPGIQGSRRLEYFIGSGAAGRSYLFSDAGFLFQAPVSYYAAAGKWDASPGFKKYHGLHLTRAVEPGCLNCHASRLQWKSGTQNGYGDAVFLEGGIACERCHGSGEGHKVVNPAKLPADRRDSICAQCHLTGEVRIARAGAAPYHPGDRFSDRTVTFVWQDRTPDMKVASHFEKLAMSACKKASGDKLWCGTCHDPHSKVADYRARCIGCHQQRECHRGDDCITCHMPKSPVRDVEHAVYTDHSIPRKPRPERQAEKRALVAFGGAQASDREYGLAYSTIPGFERKALELLRSAARSYPDDPPLLVQLADLYDRSGDEAQALPLYEKALKLDPSQTVAAVNLAAALIKRGQAQEAMRLWRDALARNPGLEAARLNLAVAQFRSGDRKGAEATLGRLLELSPGNAIARRMLGELRR